MLPFQMMHRMSMGWMLSQVVCNQQCMKHCGMESTRICIFLCDTPKGMRQVLEERGVNTKKMKAEKMQEVLGEMTDLNTRRQRWKSWLLYEPSCTFLIPKFHCELNPIEACWCHSKRYTQSNSDYTFPGLLATVPVIGDSISIDTIRKFFRKTRETIKTYRERLTPGSEMTRALFNVLETLTLVYVT